MNPNIKTTYKTKICKPPISRERERERERERVNLMTIRIIGLHILITSFILSSV